MNTEHLNDLLRKIIFEYSWLMLLKMHTQIEMVTFDGFVVVYQNDEIFYEYPNDWSEK